MHEESQSPTQSLALTPSPNLLTYAPSSPGIAAQLVDEPGAIEEDSKKEEVNAEVEEEGVAEGVEVEDAAESKHPNQEESDNQDKESIAENVHGKIGVWEVCTDEYGNVFYFNPETNESSWERPQEGSNYYYDSAGGESDETEFQQEEEYDYS